MITFAKIISHSWQDFMSKPDTVTTKPKKLNLEQVCQEFQRLMTHFKQIDRDSWRIKRRTIQDLNNQFEQCVAACVQHQQPKALEAVLDRISTLPPINQRQILEIVDSNRDTLTHHLVRHNWSSLWKFMRMKGLTMSLDQNTPNCNKYPPILEACVHGRYDWIHTLWGTVSHPYKTHNGITPLQVLVQNYPSDQPEEQSRYKDCMEGFILDGSEPQVDDRKLDCLHLAIKTKDTDLVDFLRTTFNTARRRRRRNPIQFSAKDMKVAIATTSLEMAKTVYSNSIYNYRTANKSDPTLTGCIASYGSLEIATYFYEQNKSQFMKELMRVDNHGHTEFRQAIEKNPDKRVYEFFARLAERHKCKGWKTIAKDIVSIESASHLYNMFPKDFGSETFTTSVFGKQKPVRVSGGQQLTGIDYYQQMCEFALQSRTYSATLKPIFESFKALLDRTLQPRDDTTVFTNITTQAQSELIPLVWDGHIIYILFHPFPDLKGIGVCVINKGEDPLGQHNSSDRDKIRPLLSYFIRNNDFTLEGVKQIRAFINNVETCMDSDIAQEKLFSQILQKSFSAIDECPFFYCFDDFVDSPQNGSTCPYTGVEMALLANRFFEHIQNSTSLWERPIALSKKASEKGFNEFKNMMICFKHLTLQNNLPFIRTSLSAGVCATFDASARKYSLKVAQVKRGA